MCNNWLNFSPKTINDTWDLIYVVSYMFDLHDIFEGSFISERAIYNCKKVLKNIVETQGAKLSIDQKTEVDKMLQIDLITREEKYLNDFDDKAKDIRLKLGSRNIEEKIQGISDLIDVYGESSTYSEQLELFATKTKQLVQLLLQDINPFRDQLGQPAFAEFLTKLMDFVNCVICDPQFSIVMDEDLHRPVLNLMHLQEDYLKSKPRHEPMEYELEYLGTKLTTKEGLFATLATITNFSCKFSDETIVLEHLFVLLRRLYNFFPKYRQHLEDSMILTFTKIQSKWNNY